MQKTRNVSLKSFFFVALIFQNNGISAADDDVYALSGTFSDRLAPLEVPAEFGLSRPPLTNWDSNKEPLVDRIKRLMRLQDIPDVLIRDWSDSSFRKPDLGVLRWASNAQKAVDFDYRHLFGILDFGKGYSQEFGVLPEVIDDYGDILNSGSRTVKLSYFTGVEKAKAGVWVDGSYLHEDYYCRFKNCRNGPVVEWAAGATFDLAKITLVGYYSDRKDIDFNSFRRNSGMLRSDMFGTYYPRDGYRVLGSYTINETTRLGISYGSGDLDFNDEETTQVIRNNFEKSLWTVGVYHDVHSWLRIVAEYNRTEVDLDRNSGHGTDSISVGGVLSW